MIRTEKGEVAIEGTVQEIMADLATLTLGVRQHLISITNDPEGITELVKCAISMGLITEVDENGSINMDSFFDMVGISPDDMDDIENQENDYTS